MGTLCGEVHIVFYANCSAHVNVGDVNNRKVARPFSSCSGKMLLLKNWPRYSECDVQFDENEQILREM